MGLVGGILAGVGVAALLAVFALRYQVNQVVLGVVLVALASGLTSFLLGQIPERPGDKQYLNEPRACEPIAIPGLSDIPVIGQALFKQTLLVYLMYLSVAVVTFLLFQTRWGLRVRSVGEHPKAADTVGIKVNRIRWQAVLLGGVFAGLGGAYFTVGRPAAFDKDADRRQRLHRARRRDHGPLAPGLGDVRGAVLRLHVEPAEPAAASSDKCPASCCGAARTSPRSSRSPASSAGSARRPPTASPT